MPNQKIGNPAFTQYDGLHYDPVVGDTLANGATGSPENPLNNLNDIQTQMTVTGLHKLYLDGAQRVIGTQTGANNATVMTDAAATFIPNTLIGLTIFNVTDHSSGVITANTVNTVTVTALSGGGDNTFETNDSYRVPYAITLNQNITCQIVGNPGYDVHFTGGLVELYGELICGSIYGSTYVDIQGDVFCAGEVIYNGGVLSINGKLTTGQASPFYPQSYWNGGITLSGGVAFFALSINCGGSLTDNGSVAYIFGDCNIYEDFFATSDSWLVTGSVICQFGALVINAGNLTICGDISTQEYVGVSGAGGTLVVHKDINSTGGITLGAGASLTCNNLYSFSNFTANADGITAIINGECNTSGTFALGGGTSGTMTVAMNLMVKGTIAILAGASLVVSGYGYLFGAITNNGTLTYHGVYPEKAVNTTTGGDFLSLVLITGFHWTIDDLVLKVADPGANSIYVILSKLVNGIVTAINVDSAHPNGFVINSLNYTTYWSLNDMFGRDTISGDYIEIAVVASAGGPYAVTGSYSYHSS